MVINNDAPVKNPFSPAPAFTSTDFTGMIERTSLDFLQDHQLWLI